MKKVVEKIIVFFLIVLSSTVILPLSNYASYSSYNYTIDKHNIDPKLSIMIIIPVVFLGISIALWYKLGRNDTVVETVEFYPPEGLNSLDVALIYKGKVNRKDVTSLLVYLADKGYIEIIENDKNIDLKKVNLKQETKNSTNQKILELENKIIRERTENPLSKKIKYYENMLNIYKNIDTPINYEQYGIKPTTKKNGFKIRKIKDYDGENSIEKCFMDELFEYGRIEVKNNMLYDHSFYLTIRKILSAINSTQNRERIFEDSSLNPKSRKFISFMFLVTYCLITILPMLRYSSPYFEKTTLVEKSFLVLFAIVLPAIGIIECIFRKADIISRILIILYGFCIWRVLLLSVLIQDIQYFIAYILGIVCMIGMMWCALQIPRKTKYGTEMLGKIRGFKNFLISARKEELEALVEKNPNYFYDILPYTYVLGVSNKWIKKFENIAMVGPFWYEEVDNYDISAMETFLNFMGSCGRRR